MISTSRRGIILSLALAAGSLAPVAAQADWTRGLQDERCNPETAEAMSNALREAIEGSVRRAESVILPPTPVGDLGCLNDLMSARLASFSNMGGILDSLSGGLGSFDGSSIGLDIDVSGMICRAAAERWAELTEPLSDVNAGISDYAGIASSAQQRMASGGFSFVPGVRGTSDYNDRTPPADGGSDGTAAASQANAQPFAPAATPLGSQTNAGGSASTGGNSIWDSLGN